MDPLTQGIEIFKQVADRYSWSTTEDINDAKSFLDAILVETRGLVIVDFLDAGSWDCIEGVEIVDNHIILKWHDYRDKIEEDMEKDMRRMVFPADLYASIISFNELVVVRGKEVPFILLRGYAMKDKEIKSVLAKNAEDSKIFDDYNNFSKRLVVKKSGKFEVYDCINTPIFSMIIIPKRAGISSSDSKKALYKVNLLESDSRLSKVMTSLEDENLKDKDLICEKANSVRRIFESILKIECCYRYRKVNVKKDYSDMMLGDLIKLVKEFRDDSVNTMLNQIVILSNELSHDSGKPVSRSKGLLLVTLASAYNTLLQADIDLNPHFG